MPHLAMKLLFPLAAWLLAAHTVFGETVNTDTASDRVRWIGCPWNTPPGEDFYCGLFKVPLSRTVDTGKTIEIFFSVLLSLSEQPSAEPLLMINGGPGAPWPNPTSGDSRL